MTLSVTELGFELLIFAKKNTLKNGLKWVPSANTECLKEFCFVHSSLSPLHPYIASLKYYLNILQHSGMHLLFPENHLQFTLFLEISIPALGKG